MQPKLVGSKRDVKETGRESKPLLLPPQAFDSHTGSTGKVGQRKDGSRSLMLAPKQRSTAKGMTWGLDTQVGAGMEAGPPSGLVRKAVDLL